MVSPRKPATSVSSARRLAPKAMATPAKSCESLFSASSRESACLIYQRKQTQQPKSMNCNGATRSNSLIPNSSEIHQRVMSARNLRLKTFQNQLADAQAEIANLAHENRMLRTLHKRQSSALSKYESTNAELPQLLHSHAEELRVWQTKHRNLQALNKELEQKLKQKEVLILSLSDQNKHYSQLNKDKNLDERQRLQEKLRHLEQRLLDKDNDMKLMARKVQLESKNFRQQLLNEQKKSKESMLKLEKARLEISGYRKLEEFTLGGDKGNSMASGRRAKLNIVEEPDKIDKLEKSVEMLEKAIEKNNQSDFNALTDVLETDSLFDFDKDEADDKADLQQQMNGGLKRGNSGLSKLTLPPATNPAQQSKQSQQQLSSTRSTLSQALASSKSVGSNKSGIPIMSRLLSGGGGGGSTSASSKRRELDRVSAKSDSKSKQQALKSLTSLTTEVEDYSYENDDYEPGVEDSFALMAELCAENDNGEHDEEEENANEASLVNFAAYLDAKSGGADGLEEEEDDEDDDNDSAVIVHTPSMKENMSSIRKQISDDYKERESFLNTFCRQASSSNVREDPALKKRNSIAATDSSNRMAGNRKHALLAALKAIDDNKSQD